LNRLLTLSADVVPAATEDADNSQLAHADDQPAQERVVSLERLAGDAGGPQPGARSA